LPRNALMSRYQAWVGAAIHVNVCPQDHRPLMEAAEAAGPVVVQSVGTCHIAVTFKSGAPEYETDVALVQGTDECEAVCAPMPTSPVVIPDVDGGSGVDGDAGCDLGEGAAGGEGGAQW
jgi:hypothetical protein